MKNIPYLNLPLTSETNIALPQPINNINQSYSLENDMIFGWVPSYNLDEPMNLQFMNELNDEVIQLYQNKELEKIVYLGNRPANTSEFHKIYSTTSNYQYKQFKNRIEKEKNQKQLFVGMNPQSKSTLSFNSSFEGGNLDLAIMKSSNEYDLYIRVDTNTQGHNMWYYFEINGFENCDEIKLNICNFRKKRCLYERGMKPYIWRCSSSIWQQEGENVKYSNYRFQSTQSQKQYYCLSFTLKNQSKDDKIKIAYCIPYTYTQLNSFLKTISCKYLEQSSLCASISGVSIPKLTLCKREIMNKKVIVIQARIHPGESNSSWVMEGLINYLISPAAEKLLDNLIFIIVPMMNVDGVIFGNYRTGCGGRDLNRKFRDTCKSFYPTVYAMKQLIKDLHQLYGDQLIGFFDIHGHSAKKNAFLYGPEFQVWSSNYYKSRLFAKILSKKTSVFRYYSCLFRIHKCKLNTARAVFRELCDFVHCFTIEVSNSSYYDDQVTYNFTIESWLQLGFVLGESFYDFISTLKEMEIIFQDPKERKMISSIKKQSSKITNDELNYQQLKKVCQSSKFSQLFQEMETELPNLSFSEGGSDSENDSDDLNETYLQHILYQTKQKNKKQLKIATDFPKLKRKITENYGIPGNTPAKNVIKEFKEDPSNGIFEQTANQSIYRKSSYKLHMQVKRMKVEKAQTLGSRLSCNTNNLTTFRATFIAGQQTKLEEVGHYSRNKSPIKLKTLIENTQDAKQLEFQSNLNEDNMGDQIFQPYINRKTEGENMENQRNKQFSALSPKQFIYNKFNYIMSTHYQTEDSNYNIATTIYHGNNHPEQQRNKPSRMQQLQKMQNPTHILRNTLQVQKICAPEDIQGITIKPKLFSSPQVVEQAHFSKPSRQTPQQETTNGRKQRQSVPSSFYSIKKHWTNTRGTQQYVKIGK